MVLIYIIREVLTIIPAQITGSAVVNPPPNSIGSTTLSL
jgi:hypothetical protein